MGCSISDSTPPKLGAMYGSRTESMNRAVSHRSPSTWGPRAGRARGALPPAGSSGVYCCASRCVAAQAGASRRPAQPAAPPARAPRAEAHARHSRGSCEPAGFWVGPRLEADHAAKAAHLLNRNGVVAVAGQARVVHAADARVRLQPARHLAPRRLGQRPAAAAIRPTVHHAARSAHEHRAAARPGACREFGARWEAQHAAWQPQAAHA